MQERELRCSTCDGEMVFEIPPGGDSPDECPELICSRCGAAEVLVPATLRYWIRGPKSNRVAPLQRRAVV